MKLPTLTVGAGARKAARQIADPEERTSFPAHWNEPDVRGALGAMHGRVCAFCLSELTRSDRGDVEHFRPKNLYFWLAYVFDNYVLSCARCNRVFKREQFPLAPGAPRVTYDTRADLPREERLFLDPAEDPVERWLSIDMDDGFARWRVAPGFGVGTPEHARVVETVATFHWNDDPDLVKERDDAIDRALAALERGDQREVQRCASRFRPHGGAVRSLLATLPGVALPTQDEELAWLLEDILEDWRWARKLGGKLCEEKLEEMAWALAVLWKSPPSGTRLDVGAWLADAGLRGDVLPRYQEL